MMLRSCHLALTLAFFSSVGIVPARADAEPGAISATHEDADEADADTSDDDGDGGFEPAEEPRSWWQLDGALIGARDSNVFLSSANGFPGEIEDELLGIDAGADYRRTRQTSFEGSARKLWELGLSARASYFAADDESAATQSSLGASVWGERHRPLPNRAREKGTERERQHGIGRGLSYGLLAGVSSTKLDDATFLKETTGAVALTYAWKQWHECEIGRAALRISHTDAEDESAAGSDPALDRSGGWERAELAVSLTPSRSRNVVANGRCMGGSVFSDTILTTVPSYVAALEFDRVDTDGTEFRHDAVGARFAGRIPVYFVAPPEGTVVIPPLAFEWNASYRKTRHDEISIFDGIRREDDQRRVELGILIPIRLDSERPDPGRTKTIRYTDWSFHVGGLRIDNGSNVDVFDVDRTVWTISLRGVIGRLKNIGKGPKGPRSIGSHVGSGSGTAPDRPQSGSDLSANASP